MRIRAAASAALASASVLAIGWMVGAPAAESLQATLASATAAWTAPAAASTTPAGTPAATPSAAPGQSAAAQAPAATTAPAPAPAATTAPAPAASPAGITGTFAGSVVQTAYGNVQVSVAINNGTISEVTALHLTDRDSRSVSISDQAAPILRSEVLSAQSAQVQNVSGATYTTGGYLQSLQAALDAAKF